MRRSTRKTVIDEKLAREREFMACIASPTEDGLTVFDTQTKGLGVKTTKAFKKGDYVARYQGELITKKEAVTR